MVNDSGIAFNSTFNRRIATIACIGYLRIFQVHYSDLNSINRGAAIPEHGHCHFCGTV
jgi:hypothetical protein